MTFMKASGTVWLERLKQVKQATHLDAVDSRKKFFSANSPGSVRQERCVAKERSA
jgi:hypothetical protein